MKGSVTEVINPLKSLTFLKSIMNTQQKGAQRLCSFVKKIGRTTVRPNISIDTSRCMISEDQYEKGIHHLFGEAVNATKRQLCIYR